MAVDDEHLLASDPVSANSGRRFSGTRAIRVVALSSPPGCCLVGLHASSLGLGSTTIQTPFAHEAPLIKA